MIQEGYTHLVGNTGYLLLKVPQEILSEIKISVDEVQNNFSKAIPANLHLAGQIDKEYETKLTNKATQYVRWTVEQYNKHNPNCLNDHKKLFVDGQLSLIEGEQTWVNFQKKYEYNPTHCHSGVFSYVIWYQIPFYKENEIKYGAGKDKLRNLNTNGDFNFVYHDGMGVSLHPLMVDKTMEGYIAIFPSSLMHQVYPFYTSDDYRITISGNVFLNNKL